MLAPIEDVQAVKKILTEFHFQFEELSKKEQELWKDIVAEGERSRIEELSSFIQESS